MQKILLLFGLLFLYSCDTTSKSNQYCESTNLKKASYCYKWLEKQGIGQRILIYEQLVYDEQTEPLLILDAVFMLDNKKEISFEFFSQNLASYFPPEVQLPDSLGNPRPYAIQLRCDTCKDYQYMTATKVYYER